MPNTIFLFKKSATPSAIPTSLDFGEMALNYADGKMYYKNVNSAIVEFSPQFMAFRSVSANGTTLVSDVNHDILTISPGPFINILGDAVTDTITISANLTPAWTTANTALTVAQAAFAQANTGGGGGGSSSLGIVNDTTSNTTFFVSFTNVSSGNVSSHFVSNTKLTFNTATGTLSSTIFNSLSDINKKTDIEVIPYATDKVKLLNGVTFRFKDDNSESAGVIAQEVEKVLPCLVNHEKYVNYDGLTGLLIQAIKELEKRVEELEKKND